MKHIYKFFLALLVISATISCSKDDSPENTPTNTNGGEIFTSQVVTVNLPNVELAQNEYQGTLGDTPVRLIKSGDHALLFSVPAGQNGAGDLVIPALDVTVHYTTTPTVLEGTPDEVMADFNSNLVSFSSALDNSSEAVAMSNTISSFNTYYNNADEATKAQIAEVYQANKAAFDQILQPGAGRIIVAGTEIYITKHVVAVALLGVGVAALVASPVLAGVVVAAAAYKVYQTNGDAFEHVYSTIGATIGGWFGNNGGRGVNINGLTLRNDEVEQVTFTLRERRITATDASKTDPLAVQYFASVDQYNYYAAESNEIIDVTNAEEGTNYSDIPSQQLPATAQEVETEVNQEILGNVQFSINDPNLLLVSATMAQEGQLSIRVKIMGTPSSLPVQSLLNYSYSDGFSSFNGTLPIEVTDTIDLSGTWSMAITLGAGVCDEVLLIDEIGGNLNFQFNDNNTVTFLNDPASMGLNGAGWVQTYTLDGQTLSISVTSEDGSFQLETNNYNPVTNSFSGTYTDGWNGCSNTVTITKLD